MSETVWIDAELEEERQRAIEQNGELSGDPAPGSFYCHEALHMTSFLCSSIDTELCGHPAIAANPEWHRMAMSAHQKLADLYQMIGCAHHDASADPSPALSREGRGE